MRLRTINRVAEDWAAQALICYDLEIASEARVQRMHDIAKGFVVNNLKAGRKPSEVRSDVFAIVEERYMVFHTTTKRMIRVPQLLSCKKHGARKLAP